MVILLNAGAPMIFVEVPLMLVALVVVITVEFYWLKKAGITFSSVVWSNIVSTILGVILSNFARSIMAKFVEGDQSTDPFDASLFMGDNWYEGNAFVVLLVILLFDYIFSVLLEFLYYRWKFSISGKRKFFFLVSAANGVSYAIMIAIFFLIQTLQFL